VAEHVAGHTPRSSDRRRAWNPRPLRSGGGINNRRVFGIRRHDGDVQGFVGLLDLTRATMNDLALDPGTPPSPTLNASPIVAIQRYLSVKNLAWDFMTLATPERWDEYFALADLPRAAGADFTIGGRRYGLFAHDFRQRSLDAWLELITERALSQEFTALPATEPQTLVLSQQEFTEAVRQALHDLHRSDLLARNPLLWTRLVRDRAVDKESAPSALESLLRDAVATLRVHPRDDKLFRAMDRTYLRPAATQERAAAALGLPFSTYRRHLSLGLDRVVHWLWDREVYGSSEQS
jgi:hypothetical protein